MRLFIATPITLPIYTAIKQKLSPYIQGNWILGSNLHITHLFIGEQEPNNYKFRLNIPNEKIELKGLDFFNDKILYIKASSPNIDIVHKELIKKLQIHSKTFKPHVTLCRIKSIKDKTKLLNAVKEFNNLKFYADFEVYLYSSTLTPKGAIYKKLYKY
jgi:2'-5' RNA ligase